MNSSLPRVNTTYFIQPEVSLAYLTNQAIAKLASFRAELNIRNLKGAQRLLDEHFQLVTQIKQLKTAIATQAEFESKFFTYATISSQS